MSAMAEMPKYKCHKEVWALKIAAIKHDDKFPDGDYDAGDQEEPGATITPADTGYGAFHVGAQYMRKHRPEVGGYFVVYEDGYQSYSPGKAFEDGYAPLSCASSSQGAALSERAEWFSLVTGAATSLEDSANHCGTVDSEKAANGAAKHYHRRANELWTAMALSGQEPAQVVVSRFVTDETDAYLDKLRFAASEAIRTFEDAGDAMSWSPTIDAIERLKEILHGGYEYHPDDAAVDAFAWAMRDKMEESREKGRSGWDSPFQCSPERLAEMLIDHIAKGDPVDVGNFAMMLFNRPDARGVLAKVWKARASSSRAEVERVTDAMVRSALGEAWNDFVSDTGCYPSCFEVQRGKRIEADFERAESAFIDYIAGSINAALAAAEAPNGGGEVMAEKCTVRDGRFVEPCANLAGVTEYGNPRGKQKGIFAWALSKPGEGPTRTFYGVKSGDMVQRGMVLNFCPFCGERIDAPTLSSESA